MKDLGKKSSKLNIIFFSIILIAFVSIIMGVLFDYYYDLNDDAMLRDIISGAFTGEASGHAIYILYPLAAILALLSKMLPVVPWFGLFLTASVFFCLWKLLVRIEELLRHTKIRIPVMFVVVLGFFVLAAYQTVYVQYSFVAAVLASTGAFLLMTTESELPCKKFLVKNIDAVLLICIGFMLRSQMVLLMSPMIILAGLIAWFNGNKGRTKLFDFKYFLKYLILAGIILGGLALPYLVNDLAYSGEEWSDFNDYNKVRTELYDYQQYIPDYSEAEVFYKSIGLDENQVTLFKNYNIAFDESLDEEIISNIIDYNMYTRGVNYYQHSFKDSLIEYKWRMTHTEDMPWILMVWVLYGLCFIVAIAFFRWEVIFQLFLLGICRSIGWLYPMMRGRIQGRITDSLFICEIMILLAMLFIMLNSDVTDKNKKRLSASYITVAVISVVLLSQLGSQYGRIISEKERRETVNESWKILNEYMSEHDGNYYVLDVFSTVKYTDRVFKGYSADFRNGEIAGGWSNNSPIYRGKLEHAGLQDLKTELVINDCVFFVSEADRDIEWLTDYYKSIGMNVSVDEYDLIGTEDNYFSIYRVVDIK